MNASMKFTALRDAPYFAIDAQSFDALVRGFEKAKSKEDYVRRNLALFRRFYIFLVHACCRYDGRQETAIIDKFCDDNRLTELGRSRFARFKANEFADDEIITMVDMYETKVDDPDLVYPWGGN
jgi:hypothetical protein